LARPNAADLDEFRRGIDPLASAGKLGALLAQFPASFKNDDAARDYVIWLLRAFSDHRVAVELRHASWSDDLGATLKLLNEFQGRLGADRRTEIPLLDSPELSAEHQRLLLHAAARPQREAMVAA
jgi:uncharacterized protein YecE (DUF72 family)